LLIDGNHFSLFKFNNPGNMAATLKDTTVIDLYTWTTPNGRKVSIALEELGLPYTSHAVDISKDEQFQPDFLKIAPNNRIPAIIDRDNGMSLMESGAILIYLADKTGKLMAKSGEARYRAIEWTMWQMGGPGPMLGQVHHFVKYNKGKAPLRRRALPEGGAPALRRARPAADRPRIRRRRLLDRRHRDLAVDLALRVADDRHEPVSEREALVCGDRQPSGGAEGLQGAEGRRRDSDALTSPAELRRPRKARERRFF
jgi:glutathione S-transferase